MALQGTPVNLQGGSLNLQGSTPTLQGNSVGTKAVSPTNNIPKPATVLPKAQAQQDFSSKYGLNNGTVYDKTTGKGFSSDTEFKAVTGYSSNGQKFDTTYVPVKAPVSVVAPAYTPPAPTPVPTPTPTPVAATPIIPTPYTPPNQGTTGVSQGGIIGNLINTANNESPEVTKARADLKALTENYGKQTANIEGSPIDLSLANGEEGILNRLFAAKQGAAQTALSSALTSQGQSIQANSAAGSLNAPITGVPYGTQTIQPSQPNGSTTSGAANISSLIGQRTGADGKTVEYYNTQTGQGFANPKLLADFVNSQIPNASVTTDNVFQLLKSGALNNTGNSGGALNPLNNVGSIAQQVISGQISPSQAYAMGGSVANWQGLLNQAIQQASPGFDTGAAEGKYAANSGITSDQAQQKAQYQSALQQGKNLQTQLTDLIKTFGLNPSDINAANAGIQKIAQNTSDYRYQILSNYVNDIANTYAQILTPPGGSATDTTRSIASSMLSATASGTSIIATMQSLDAAAQAKIAGVQTPSTVGSPSSGSSSGTAPGGFGWNGN